MATVNNAIIVPVEVVGYRYGEEYITNPCLMMDIYDLPSLLEEMTRPIKHRVHVRVL